MESSKVFFRGSFELLQLLHQQPPTVQNSTPPGHDIKFLDPRNILPQLFFLTCDFWHGGKECFIRRILHFYGWHSKKKPSPLKVNKWWSLIQSCSRITPSTWTSSQSCVKTVHWIRWDAETGSWGKLLTNKITSWWFQVFFNFHPYLGKIPNLTNIFQKGWNHQPDKICYLWVKEPADHSRKRTWFFVFEKKTELWRFLWLEHLKWPKISITFQLMRMIEIWISTLTEVSIQTKKTLEKIQAFCEIIETHFQVLKKQRNPVFSPIIF